MTNRRIGGASFKFQLYGLADFDGSGSADLLWRDLHSGRLAVWIMNGTTVAADRTLTAAGLPDEDQVNAIGDFNGDGKADLLIQNMNDNSTYVWLNGGPAIDMARGTVPRTSLQIDSDRQWEVVATGDFDGDGRSDILWHDRLYEEWFIWRMKGTQVTQSWSVADRMTTGVLGVVDIDGDGKAEVVVTTANGISAVKLYPTETWMGIWNQPSGDWQYVGGGFFGRPAGKPTVTSGLLWRNRRTGDLDVWYLDRTGAAVAVGHPGVGIPLRYQAAVN
jgi:hypothetical protein